MKKKTYKQMQNRYLRTLKRAKIAEGQSVLDRMAKESAEETANYYEKRFRAFGSNVETDENAKGYCLVKEKWELNPQTWGNYALLCDNVTEEQKEAVIQRLTQSIVDGLVKNNLLQIVEREGCGPFEHNTVAVKLYVIPWEQIPHKRTMAVYRYAENTLQRRT